MFDRAFQIIWAVLAIAAFVSSLVEDGATSDKWLFMGLAALALSLLHRLNADNASRAS